MLVDDDGRVFMYSGCSDDGPISAVELNSSTWREIGAPVVALRSNSSVRGFEQGGDNNDLPGKTPYVEGAWMSKLGGRQPSRGPNPNPNPNPSPDQDLAEDLPRSVARIAAWMGVPCDAPLLERVCALASFEFMSAEVQQSTLVVACR